MNDNKKENNIHKRITEEAMEWLGTPYRHQGVKKGIGCDCLGLVLGVWKNVYGLNPPHNPGPYTPDWAEAAREDRFFDAAEKFLIQKPIETREAGNLVLFRWKPNFPAKHAAIMIEPERFIHAYEGHCVALASLVPQWLSKIAGVFSFPEFSRG